MICDRCGRLLNRATGKCGVCADHGGAAPPPVATLEAAAGPEAEELALAEPAVSGVGARSGGYSLAAPMTPVGAAVDPNRPPGSLAARNGAAVDPNRPPGSPAARNGTAVRGKAAPPDAAPDAGDEGTARSVAATLRPSGAQAPPPPPRPRLAQPEVAADAAPLPSVPSQAPPPDQPISVGAAVAILDLNDRPEKVAKEKRTPIAPPPPAEPPPPPRVPGSPFGVIRHGRLGRRKVDLVVYEGSVVVARRGAPTNLLSGQLAAQDPTSRVIAGSSAEEVVVREDPVSGQARIRLKNGEELVLRWPGWKNRGTSAENLLTHAFSGKVDQGSSEIAQRTVRLMAAIGVAILVAVGSFVGLSVLLKGDPPPPPPPAPPTTLPAAEQAARTELQAACPPWQAFAAGVRPGDRPDPNAMRPIVDGMRGHFDNAAAAGADGSYAIARDELGYLQDFARRPVDVVGRESVSRVAYAMRTVSASCTRATLGS